MKDNFHDQFLGEGGTATCSLLPDMFGEVTQTVASQSADFGDAGMYFHAPSGLNLATYRAYSSSMGRWINRDPADEEGGTNLYDYVSNNPVGGKDPLGLQGLKAITENFYYQHFDEFALDVFQTGYFPIQVSNAYTEAASTAAASGLDPSTGGLQDAYRHCLWACIMAKQGFFGLPTGGHGSRIITNNHEFWNKEHGEPADQIAQDKANNAKGRDLSKCNRPCKDSCLDAARNGGLTSLGGAPFAPLYGPGF